MSSMQKENRLCFLPNSFFMILILFFSFLQIKAADQIKIGVRPLEPMVKCKLGSSITL